MYIELENFNWNLKLLQEELGKDYLSDNTKKKLSKEICKQTIKSCLIERPYIDKDFRDSYYNDFSKRFKYIERDSIRLHLLGVNNTYYGYITLRDTPPFNLGRSYLEPTSCRNAIKGWYCLTSITSNIVGEEVEYESFPWMQKDINTSMCAHIASWAVLRYLSLKKKLYPEVTLFKVAQLSDENIRRVPSKGLTVDQIAQTFTRSGHSTEIYMKDSLEKGIDDQSLKKSIFKRICYSMIESGMPYVAGINGEKEFGHAVALIGHGTATLPNEDELDEKAIIDIGDCIDYFISIDDNKLPFYPVNGDNEYNKLDEGLYEYSLSDIDTIIVPLHEKMYLDIIHLYSFILPKIEENLGKVLDCKLIRRVFLSSSNSFKKFLYTDLEEGNNEEYNTFNRYLSMPQFIWIVEYFDFESYNRQEVISRFVLDATGKVYSNLDDILISAKVDTNLYLSVNGNEINEEVEVNKYTKAVTGNLRRIM